MPAASPPPTVWYAAQHAAVLCDVPSLAALVVAGADATAFLQGQLSNDAARLTPDVWQYTTFNSPKGRMLASIILWRDADAFRAVLAADLAAAVRKRLAMYVLRSKVDLREDDARLFGVGGPAARSVLAARLGEAPAERRLVHVRGVDVLGLPGDRWLVHGPAAAVAEMRVLLGADIQVAPAEVWAWLTIRAGVPVITAATQDRFVPQTANLDVLQGISFQKGCYTGQEIVARMQYLGRLKERLVLAHTDASEVAPGMPVFSPAFEGQACGTIVNAAPAPDGGHDVLAVAQIAAVPAGLRLGNAEGPVLAVLPFPYPVPEPAAPRRMGR